MIFFGIFFLNDRSDYFISMCIIILSMLPFFLVFENRRPQAREVVVIAVMAALAVAGRAAFFMLPQFKPTAAIVIIAGVGLGAEAGFLTGALAGFVSNFFFGQGPWTPWQMFAFGIVGFLGGLIFRRKRGKWKHFHLWLCIYGGLSVLVIYGFLLDTASVFMGMGGINKAAFLAMYASGFPMNVIHGKCHGDLSRGAWGCRCLRNWNASGKNMGYWSRRVPVWIAEETTTLCVTMKIKMMTGGY